MTERELGRGKLSAGCVCELHLHSELYLSKLEHNFCSFPSSSAPTVPFCGITWLWPSQEGAAAQLSPVVGVQGGHRPAQGCTNTWGGRRAQPGPGCQGDTAAVNSALSSVSSKPQWCWEFSTEICVQQTPVALALSQPSPAWPDLPALTHPPCQSLHGDPALLCCFFAVSLFTL